MSPRTSRAVWDKVRSEFECGTYESLKGLAEKYSITPVNLRTKIYREKWSLKRATVEHKIAQKVEEKVVSEAEDYLSSLKSRVKRYQKMIDVSQEHSGSMTSEGIPLLDPETIDTYTKSEGRLQAMGAFAHRIPAQTVLDVTSKGESFLSILQRLRADPKAITLSPADVEVIANSEIEGDSP